MYDHFEVTITPFNRKRLVRVYLPKSYSESQNKRYPVIYMHDGQNLFKDEDAGFGVSWGISDFLESSDFEVIVVGIDCSSEGFQRLDEYGPWKSKVFFNLLGEVGGEGKEYTTYIVQELKPLIDEKYRTIPDQTSMAGSSMGGLISTYAACTYPTIFKKVASVSSAFWFNQEEIEDLIKRSDLSQIEKFYLDIGTAEVTEHITSEHYVHSSQSVYPLLKEKITNCKFEIIEGAVHNEEAWRKRVSDIFSFLYK